MTLGGIWLKSQNKEDTSALYQIKQTDLLYNSLGILAEVSLFVFATKTTVTVRRSDKINSLQNDRLNMNWQFLLPSLVFFAGLRLSKAFFGLALFGLAQTAEPLEVSCFNCSCTVQDIYSILLIQTFVSDLMNLNYGKLLCSKLIEGDEDTQPQRRNL